MDEPALRRAVKEQLRDRMRRVRRALPRAAREARSARIAERIFARPEWERARTVLAFVSMRDEVRTGELVARARAEGRAVAATRWVRGEADLEVRAWAADAPLVGSGMGFRQPGPSAPLLEDSAVDLVLVPGLAFDERGHRVGYGGGFYDRLLPRLTRAVSVAVAFDFQLVPEVPATADDVPVELVVTDARVLECEGGR